MNFKIFTVLILSTLWASASAQNRVIIKGCLIGLDTRTTLRSISDVGAISFDTNERGVLTDSNGNFTLEFSLAKPNYFKLGRNVLYLTPGDSLSVVINFDKQENSVFKGRGSEVNQYLASTPNPKGGSFLYSGKFLKKTIELNIKDIIERAEQRQKKLDSVKTLDTTFVLLEKARLATDVINSFNHLPGFLCLEFNISGEEQEALFSKFNSLKTPYYINYSKGLLNSRNLKIEVFRKNIGIILQYGDLKNEKLKLQDWINAENLFYEIISSKNRDDLDKVSLKMSSIEDNRYKTALKKDIEVKAALWEGEEAKDFAVTDHTGKALRLSSLKGKIIFIDIWATWCGPCLEEMPFFNKIKDQYRNQKNIVFVSLCVNDTKRSWQNKLKQKNLTGIQWFAETPETLDYQFTNLPRTIIIGKDFKLIRLFGPRPSDKETTNFIDKILIE